MTKYILHGGYADRESVENYDFYKEILKDCSSPTNVLLVLFSRPDEMREELGARLVSLFERNSEDISLSFEIAKESNFLAQVKRADVVYLRGGDTLKLLNTLKVYNDLKNNFLGKVIAGESAGAYVLSNCFYSKTIGGVMSGLGHVPVNTICHFEDKNADKLSECSQDSETLLLPNYKFKVFEGF